MKRAVYAGSFDPFTNGHLAIVKRAVELFDELIIGVGQNQSKTTLFSPSERVTLIQASVPASNKVKVQVLTGLTADFARQMGAHYLIRGLRTAGDFEYEQKITEMNYQLAGLETVYLQARPSDQMLASSMLKEVAMAGGNVSPYVPSVVKDALEEKMEERGSCTK